MDIDFPKLEKRILKSWRRNKTFEKSISQRAKARNFVFYEGPPTANGRREFIICWLAFSKMLFAATKLCEGLGY